VRPSERWQAREISLNASSGRELQWLMYRTLLNTLVGVNDSMSAQAELADFFRVLTIKSSNPLLNYPNTNKNQKLSNWEETSNGSSIGVF
jgi:hypothetical protein